ncbi:MAG: hypothetical protein BWY56_01377 [Acidobacteria bacterium ADurb.Bin340]|nr:MAG: hypothetical protein BWY56_01377 [Acidobacteria bacterium ADurb.Bin340]
MPSAGGACPVRSHGHPPAGGAVPDRSGRPVGLPQPCLDRADGFRGRGEPGPPVPGPSAGHRQGALPEPAHLGHGNGPGHPPGGIPVPHGFGRGTLGGDVEPHHPGCGGPRAGGFRDPHRHHGAQAQRGGAGHGHFAAGSAAGEHAGGHPGGNRTAGDRPHQRDVLPVLRGAGPGAPAGGKRCAGTAGPLSASSGGSGCGEPSAGGGPVPGDGRSGGGGALAGWADLRHRRGAHPFGRTLPWPLLAGPRHHGAQAGGAPAHPGRHEPGDEELGAGGGPGRSVAPGGAEERVPGQHEPRDPHPHERHHRHVGPAAGLPPGRRAAGIRGHPAVQRPDPAAPHQRHPGFLQDRGREAGAGTHPVRSAGSAG